MLNMNMAGLRERMPYIASFAVAVALIGGLVLLGGANLGDQSKEGAAASLVSEPAAPIHAVGMISTPHSSRLTSTSSHTLSPANDAQVQTAAMGLDYERVLKLAPTDDRALGLFFYCGSVVDAGGAQDYSGDVGRVLDRVGEEKFMQVLKSSVGTQWQKKVLAAVRYNNGDLADSQKAFGKKYPKLAKWMNSSLGKTSSGTATQVAKASTSTSTSTSGSGAEAGAGTTTTTGATSTSTTATTSTTKSTKTKLAAGKKSSSKKLAKKPAAATLPVITSATTTDVVPQ